MECHALEAWCVKVGVERSGFGTAISASATLAVERGVLEIERGVLEIERLVAGCV